MNNWVYSGTPLSKGALKVHHYIVEAYTIYLAEQTTQERYVGQSKADEIAAMRSALVASGEWLARGEDDNGDFILTHVTRPLRLRFQKVGRTKERYFFEPLVALMPADFSFTISADTASVLGLDDTCRYADIKRTATKTGRRDTVYCEGTREALISLLTEINDRATEDETGYNESGPNKRVCRADVKRLAQFGWTPRT